MAKKNYGACVIVASVVACAPQIAISDSSKVHIQNFFDKLSEGRLLAQVDDYDEFFLDQPVDPFSEEQWFEITPQWAEMFPTPPPEPGGDSFNSKSPSTPDSGYPGGGYPGGGHPGGGYPGGGFPGGGFQGGGFRGGHIFEKDKASENAQPIASRSIDPIDQIFMRHRNTG